jgi:hypothetical protein
MATWCQNNLIISGSGNEVNRFISENREKDRSLLFSKSIREPEHDLGQDGLDEWRFAKWGTISEADMVGEIEIEKRNHQVTAKYFFMTISDPANRWLEWVIVKYPSLSFCLIYGEKNLNIGGAIIAKNGKVISTKSGTARDYLVNHH